MTAKYCTFIVAVLIVGSFGKKSSFGLHNLCNSISVILKDFHIANNNNIVIHVNYKNSSNEQIYYFNDIVRGLVAESKNSTFNILYNSHKIIQNVQHKEVILLDSVQSLYYFYKKLYNSGTMNLSYTLLFITSIRTFDYSTIKLIFKDLYRMSILNIGLVIQQSDYDIILVTYFPFSPTACHNFAPVAINRYNVNQHSWANCKYFPRKLENFHGCPLICATWEEMPYLLVKLNDTTTNIVIEYVGYEGKLLEFAANIMNFTTRIYMMNTEEIVGTFKEPAATLGKILSNYADFAIGCFYYDANITQLPYVQTMYYYLSNVFIVTNVFNNDYTPYEKLTFAFKPYVWCSIGVMFVLSAVLICACSCSSRTRQQRDFIIGATNRTPYYNLFAMAMGGAMTFSQLPRYNFARFLLTCWLLATLILRSAYQSGMYQLLRDNKQRNPPQTIANVIEQGYEILVLGAQKRYLYSLHLENVQDINQMPVELYSQIANANKRIGIVVPYEFYGYLRKVISGTMQQLHLVNERIFTQHLAVYVRHNSYLVNELNTHIADAQNFGFTARWEREYFGSRSNGDNYADTKEQTNILSMQELGAVFMILVWMHVTAIMVCLIEIMWHKWKTRKMLTVVSD